jgi:hypothetical protein
MEWDVDGALRRKRVQSEFRSLPVGDQMRRILEFLQQEEGHAPVTLKRIGDEFGVSLDAASTAALAVGSTSGELLRSLHQNPRLVYHQSLNAFSYKSKYAARNRYELLVRLKEARSGILASDLTDTYPNCVRDIEELVRTGEVIRLRNTVGGPVLFARPEPLIVPLGMKGSAQSGSTVLKTEGDLRSDVTRGEVLRLGSEAYRVSAHVGARSAARGAAAAPAAASGAGKEERVTWGSASADREVTKGGALESATAVAPHKPGFFVGAQGTGEKPYTYEWTASELPLDRPFQPLVLDAPTSSEPSPAARAAAGGGRAAPAAATQQKVDLSRLGLSIDLREKWFAARADMPSGPEDVRQVLLSKHGVKPGPVMRGTHARSTIIAKSQDAILRQQARVRKVSARSAGADDSHLAPEMRQAIQRERERMAIEAAREKQAATLSAYARKDAQEPAKTRRRLDPQ